MKYIINKLLRIVFNIAFEIAKMLGKNTKLAKWTKAFAMIESILLLTPITNYLSKYNIFKLIFRLFKVVNALIGLTFLFLLVDINYLDISFLGNIIEAIKSIPTLLKDYYDGLSLNILDKLNKLFSNTSNKIEEKLLDKHLEVKEVNKEIVSGKEYKNIAWYERKPIPELSDNSLDSLRSKYKLEEVIEQKDNYTFYKSPIFWIGTAMFVLGASGLFYYRENLIELIKEDDLLNKIIAATGVGSIFNVIQDGLWSLNRNTFNISRDPNDYNIDNDNELPDPSSSKGKQIERDESHVTPYINDDDSPSEDDDSTITPKASLILPPKNGKPLSKDQRIEFYLGQLTGNEDINRKYDDYTTDLFNKYPKAENVISDDMHSWMNHYVAYFTEGEGDYLKLKDANKIPPMNIHEYNPDFNYKETGYFADNTKIFENRLRGLFK